MAEIKSNWVARNRESVRQVKRENSYKRQYGISIADYNRMFALQNGRCAVCGSTDSKRKSDPHFVVDHCHATGKIRGLLCVPCNSAIGMLGDSEQILLNVINYLKRA